MAFLPRVPRICPMRGLFIYPKKILPLPQSTHPEGLPKQRKNDIN